MLKIIAIVFVVLVAAVLLFAATRPDTFSVQRTTSIKAPPDKIFALVNDLRRFNTWNPYEKKDPNLKGSYSGAASGKGAVYAFAGNQDVGKGSVEIMDSAPPHKVSMQLHMIEPMEARNNVEFTIEPRGDSTNVTWAMHGPVSYFGKIVHLFFNMDRMVGGDFEAGLANLKAVAEQ
jgi:carbon monoxide dehydrogenase subunit G